MTDILPRPTPGSSHSSRPSRFLPPMFAGRPRLSLSIHTGPYPARQSGEEKPAPWAEREIICGALVSRPRSPRSPWSPSPPIGMGEKPSAELVSEEPEEEWDEKAELSLEVPGIVLTEPDLDSEFESESDAQRPRLTLDFSSIPAFSPPPSLESTVPRCASPLLATPAACLSPNQILLLPPSTLPVPSGPTTPPSELAYTFTAPSAYPSQLYSPAFARFLAKGSFTAPYAPAHAQGYHGRSGNSGRWAATRAGAALKAIMLLLLLLLGAWHVYTTLNVDIALSGNKWAPDFRQ